MKRKQHCKKQTTNLEIQIQKTSNFSHFRPQHPKTLKMHNLPSNPKQPSSFHVLIPQSSNPLTHLNSKDHHPSHLTTNPSFTAVPCQENITQSRNFSTSSLLLWLPSLSISISSNGPPNETTNKWDKRRLMGWSSRVLDLRSKWNWGSRFKINGWWFDMSSHRNSPKRYW